MPIGERVKRGLNLPSQEISFVKHEARFNTVKKVNNFPVPSRDVTNQALPGRE
jgi:hypothetical protein